MNNRLIKRILSFAMATVMLLSMAGDVMAVSAFADEPDTTVETPLNTQETTPAADPVTPPAEKCTYCSGEHKVEECTVKCRIHGIEHNDAACPRHITCSLCGNTGHSADDCSGKCKCSELPAHLEQNCPLNCDLCKKKGHVDTDCPDKCTVHFHAHLEKDCPRFTTPCSLCKKLGHDTLDCPDGCAKHLNRHLAAECPDSAKTNDNIYITNYRVVDNYGNALAKVNPGDKVIVAVTVIDERVKAEDFGISGNNISTNRIHATMSQGAFNIASSSNINVKLRNNVQVKGENGYYNALCYTVEFRDVTYLGGAPEFGFSISYTGHGSNITQSNNIPMPYPQENLSLAVTQATDDVPAPTIILNSANYGKVAIVGEAFNLVTAAVNTSKNLDLENVSVKIELPQGINMAGGNSQVLIGNVPRNGSINHTFNLVAEGVANDINSLPVKLVYTFEAFVGGKRTRFTSEQDISVNVQQPTRFAIQNISNDLEMYMGYESYAAASLVNKGKTTVYNVTAELVSDTLSAPDVEFLGNIAPGTSTEASFDFTASQLGTATGKILITYEDAMGIQSTLEQSFTIEVIEEPVWNEPVVTEPVVVEKNNNALYIGAVVAALAVAGGVVFMKKRKAKKLKELEDEDEDI